MIFETEYMALRRRVPTDKARLEEEILETPMLLLEASEHAAAAIQIRDGTKQDLDRITSEVAQELRESDAKASEQRVLSLLPSQEKVVVAAAALDEAKHDAAVWQALATAFSEKASLLRRIAELVTSGYSSLVPPRDPSSATRAAMAEKRADNAAAAASGFRPRGASGTAS